MATQFNFDGKTVIRPGVRATIKSGIKNPPIQADSGTLLVVDTGSNATWGGGAGINGTLESGKEAMYKFDNIDDFRNFIKGGIWWKLAFNLFRPAGLSFNGISNITFIRAAETTPAEIELSFTGDGDGSESVVNGGDLTIQVTDEGLIGNASLNTNGELIKGFAVKMVQGVIDDTKYKLVFYRGDYTGDDQNGLSFDNISSLQKKPVQLVESIEFDNVTDLVTWMNTDSSFKSYFKLSSSTVNGDGTVDEYDLSNNEDYQLASGGTEDYASSTAIQNVKDAIKDMDVAFVLLDDWGLNAQSATNFELADWAINEMTYKPEVYVAAGSTKSEFEFSKQTAAFYDNDAVSVVHGGEKEYTSLGEKLYDSIYKAAKVLAREAGLDPQIPITFKGINIDADQHIMNNKEIIQALSAGLLVTNEESAIEKGVNSLQNNRFLINEDGTISSKQIKRITRQLNKEIIINAKNQILKDPNGVNRNTITEDGLKNWLRGFLRTKIALPNADNLILNFDDDITVTRVQDAYKVSYRFTPNSEISFIFFTGLIINV